MQYYFITGTSSGIGKALAEAILMREDACVYGISRTFEIVHERYRHVFADLSDADQLEKVYALFGNTYAPADALYLINNAGVVDPIKHAGSFSEADIQKNMQVNLIAAMQLINAFLKIPDPSFGKRVILSVSSGAATKIIDGWSLYGPAKAALDHFSLHAAKELEMKGRKHTHVFSVAPGVVDTQMQAAIRNTAEADFSTVERFKALEKNQELVSPAVIAGKYLRILDHPQDYPNVIFSLRDIK